MTRFPIPLILLALAACAPTVPESGPGSGVGFDNYSGYETARIERERMLRSQNRLPPGPLSQETIANIEAAIDNAPLQGAGAPLDATGTATAAAPVVTVNNPGISDEQDFTAVSERQSIQSDAERLAAQREAFQVIQPEALPTRTRSSGPNIVEFALSTSNNVGQSVYRRSGFNAENRFQRACSRYATADQAQQDFLASGGPEDDTRGVDPDGDGFACYWDPRPFRTARGG